MANDVISAESELFIAARKLAEYGEFLGSCMESYADIIRRVGREGIRDDKISPKLELIALTISAQKMAVANEGTNLKSNVSKYMDKIEDVDKFNFPSEILLLIQSIFSAFS